MEEFILIWKYHDTHVEYFYYLHELRDRYYKLIQEYRNDNNFNIKAFRIKTEIEFE